MATAAIVHSIFEFGMCLQLTEEKTTYKLEKISSYLRGESEIGKARCGQDLE